MSKAIEEVIDFLDVYTDDACEIYDWLHEMVCIKYSKACYNDVTTHHCTENMERYKACKMVKYAGSNWHNVVIENVE